MVLSGVVGRGIMEDRCSSVDLAELVRRLQLCHRSLRASLEQSLADLGMSDSEFLVMGACHKSSSEPIVQGSIASLIGLSPAQLSALVERLRQRGWLTVQRAPGDRRKQLLATTSLGTEQLKLANERLHAFAASLTTALPLAQRSALCQSLERLAEFCEQASPCDSPAVLSLRTGEAA